MTGECLSSKDGRVVHMQSRGGRVIWVDVLQNEMILDQPETS